MTATLFRMAAAQLSAKELKFIREHVSMCTLEEAETISDERCEAGHEGAPIDSSDGSDGSEENTSPDGRHRQHIEREWPEVGTKLVASYFETAYAAMIIPATKKLKSGKQIRIESGPAAGTICDSYSEAMLVATQAQRVREHLGRKGVSNGWTFWEMVS